MLLLIIVTGVSSNAFYRSSVASLLSRFNWKKKKHLDFFLTQSESIIGQFLPIRTNWHSMDTVNSTSCIKSEVAAV